MSWLYGVATVPPGRVVPVRVTAPPAATVRLIGPLTLCGGLELSVRVTTGFAIPGAVGVPLTVHPVSGRPAGRAPSVIEQVKGASPPVALMIPSYGVPT